MNGKDKISVIIPCYNVQKYIMRCFDSIYSQTYGFENLEVILIDDLSTDNTWSILESLQRKYPENVISLKIQKKGKCGGARNLGMDICTGKYITFVDADDYVHPDMLRVLYDRMTEDDYDVAQCGVSCFKADKPNVLEVNDLEIQRLDLDNVDNRKNLIIGLTGFTSVTAWAKLYSTKFIIMSLDHTRKLSPKKINIWTVTIMMIIAAVQAYHKTQTLMYRVSGDELIWNKIIVFIQLIAGMLIVVYMCDRATKYGIGGKVSVFMVNMVSGMMTMFTGKPLEKLALPVAIGVAEIAVMIVLETTEKRIAVQRVSINNIYADKNYIAYKLNPVGATPLMFASAAFLLPQFMCNGLHYLFPDNADIQWWMDNMRLTSPLGIVVYMVIICLLTIIFSMVMLSPGRTADDLLKSGDSIQDIYAGKPTKRYLIGTVLSFSVISSIIICICQGGPLFLQFGGYVDASLAMLPCSIMMTTGLWISLYREAEVYRNMDRYHTFI